MNVAKLLAIFLITLIVAEGSAAQSSLPGSEFNLLPVPQIVKDFGRSFPIDDVRVSDQKWTRYVEMSGLQVSDSSNYRLEVQMTDSLVPGKHLSEEAYTLCIDSTGIKIRGISHTGIFWAFRTLGQLYGNCDGNLPQIEIIDWPAFPFRGFTMDAGRTFIPIDELKREIEALSLFKMNVFHWHLTENQAWRLESSLYPELNDSVNMTRCCGQFYTKQECRELVDFARDLNVTVIPELDMPGHSEAFTRTFGFDMQSVEGKEIAGQLLREACETFYDAPVIHIGTDEVKFTDPHFATDMTEIVHSNNKKAMAWTPGWKYRPGQIDLLQMWSWRGKPTPGIPVIDSRFHYINHYDIYADIRALYRSKIYHREEADSIVKGVCLALWNDRYVEGEENIIAQNNFYPLLMATAERAWRGGGTEYFDSLGTIADEPGTEDHELFADFERRLLYYKDTQLANRPIPYNKQSGIEWLITDPFPNNGDLRSVFPPEIQGPKRTYALDEAEYQTRKAYGAGIYLRHVWGSGVPSLISDPMPNHTVYAFTQIYSPINQEAGLQFETQNYSRSEPDLPPPSGKWDFRHSQLWFNGEEINPVEWNEVGSERSNENPLGNENIAARPPIAVQLHEGWNTVMIKLPVGQFTNADTRLVKWMFTFMLTTPDGTKELPGIIYSTEGF